MSAIKVRLSKPLSAGFRFSVRRGQRGPETLTIRTAARRPRSGFLPGHASAAR